MTFSRIKNVIFSFDCILFEKTDGNSLQNHLKYNSSKTIKLSLKSFLNYFVHRYCCTMYGCLSNMV